MSNVLRIAIVDPADATREPLRNLLLGVESIWMEAECARYEFFPDVVQQSQPDVAIVSLDSDTTKALALIGQVAQEYPDICILAVSGRGDGQSILHALRNGAKEFLTAPVVLEELLSALNRLSRRTSVPGSPASNGVMKTGTGSSVIAILGSRGGVGCTSVAVNLGCTLAQDPTNSVALIDLDLALGDADVALDLMPDYTLADVALNIDRLDMQFLRRSLSKHSTGLSLLPHPVQLEDVGLIREEHLQRLIGLLKASYTHLILDLSKSFSPTDLTALRFSDVILLVAQLELSSLRNVVRATLTLGNDEALANKVRVVMNRVGGETDIPMKKAEETIGKPIYHQIPNDTKPMMESRNAGVPLIQHAPRSKAQASFNQLAHNLCNRSGNSHAALPKPEKKRGFFSFR